MRTAKEIYFDLCDKHIETMDRSDIVVMAMEEYAQFKMDELICNDSAMEEYLDKIIEKRLPSEEEIINIAEHSTFLNPEWSTKFELIKAGFIDGARWFRNRIKRGE